MTRFASWTARPLATRTLAELILYRLRWVLMCLLGLATVATVGYVVIEGFGWLDALFMTVITLSTVGYAEVHPLDTAGRVFTIGVIIASFATFVYAVSTLTNLFTSGDAVAHIRTRRSRRMRNSLDSHVIVVGFGRVGQAAARGVVEMGRPCLVIDRNPANEEAIAAAGCVALIGDATREADLDEAGIQRAVALIAAAAEDDTNLIVVLTAHAVREDLRVVSRVNDVTWADRITRAGAAVAQSPYLSYGMTLAASAITPAVLDLHELPLLGLGTEEMTVSSGSRFAGLPLRAMQDAHPGVLVVGLRRDRKLHRWHDIDGALGDGDVLVVLGTPEHLRALATEV